MIFATGNDLCMLSPSLRGRGLKYINTVSVKRVVYVALFARAWIEIDRQQRKRIYRLVALFARAWIEIDVFFAVAFGNIVALFTRAWIEIKSNKNI